MGHSSGGADARLVGRDTWPAGWLSDGRLLVVFPESGEVQALDPETGAAEPLGGSMGPTLVSPDGSRIIETHSDDASGASTARLVDTASGQLLAEHPGHAGAWATDGRAAVIVDRDVPGGLVILGRDGTALGGFTDASVLNVVSMAWRPGT